MTASRAPHEAGDPRERPSTPDEIDAHVPLPDDADDVGPPSASDRRMAELLAQSSGERDVVRLRSALAADGGDDDLAGRLRAMEYLDEVCGELAGDLPERLGDYRILGVLGRGGMGTVYEAYQESLERIVALKVLSTQLSADPRMRKRFRTEARATATMHHQHIVPVYGFGEAGGLLYFAMERVEGVSLDRHVSRARRAGRPPMEPRDAARRFAGVADALHHAHRRGILHRDVKPGNVLVHPDGELALADFGLSKILGEHSMSVSRAGGFLGTLHYAAPEQALGRDPTPAADLYALGVTMFECISGRLPVNAESTEGLLHAVLHVDPPPLRKVLPTAPRDLEAVLQKLLCKEPGDRYPDGESLARDLQRIALDEPVRVRRQPLSVRLWRLARKHKVLSALVLLAFVLLVSTAFFGVQLFREEQQGRLTRYENLLTQAVARAESTAGAATGPDDVLRLLTGIGVAVDAGDDMVEQLFDSATKLLPDDPLAPELRAAWRADPLPTASAALARSHAWDAFRAIDAEIRRFESAASFASGDRTAWLRAYRLYVLRAVAALTAPVGDRAGAEKDLVRAAVVRRGAFFPRLLGELLEWRPEDGPGDLVRRLDRVAATGPAGAEAAVATLLWTVAGIERASEAQLIDLDLPHPWRLVLHDTAIERLARLGLLDAARATSRPGARGFVERALADAARRIAVSYGDASLRDAVVADQLRVLDTSVSPESPMQAWRVVFERLRAADAPVPEVAPERPLDIPRRLAGWHELLQLDLSERVFLDLREPCEALLQAAGAAAERRTVRVRAWLAARTDSPDATAAAIQDWLAMDANDAEAYLCRIAANLRAGDVEAVRFDWIVALQNAADDASVRVRLGALLEAAARREARSDVREAWSALARRTRGAR